uniref:Uncharacterized protein n=1 Tax=Magallana gigas TaxID=29159 RepID=K1RIF5_MAGGI
MTSSWRPPATPGAKGSWTNAKSFTNVRVVDNLNGKSAWHTARTEPETAAIQNPRGLKMMKLVFLVLILSFLEVFAQDPEILIDYDHMRTYPCYNRCVTKLDECKKYYDCSGRRESERQWCFLFCTNEHNSYGHLFGGKLGVSCSGKKRNFDFRFQRDGILLLPVLAGLLSLF